MAGTYGRAGGSYQLVLKMPQLTDIYISLTIIFAVTHTVIKSKTHATCPFDTPFPPSFQYWLLCSYLVTELRSLRTTSPYRWITFFTFGLCDCGCPLPSFTFRVFLSLVAYEVLVLFSWKFCLCSTLSSHLLFLDNLNHQFSVTKSQVLIASLDHSFGVWTCVSSFLLGISTYCVTGTSNNPSKSEFILCHTKVTSLFLIRRVEMSGENRRFTFTPSLGNYLHFFLLLIPHALLPFISNLSPDLAIPHFKPLPRLPLSLSVYCTALVRVSSPLFGLWHLLPCVRSCIMIISKRESGSSF